jgi:hypothetical protein
MIKGIVRGIVTKPSRAFRFQVISSETCGQSFFRTSSCRVKIALALPTIFDRSVQMYGPGFGPRGLRLAGPAHVNAGFSDAAKVWTLGHVELVTMGRNYGFYPSNSSANGSQIHAQTFIPAANSPSETALT